MRLNLGCGQNPLKDYVNVDLIRYGGVDYSGVEFIQADVLDVLTWWPWKEPVTEIHANQFLEHLKLEDGLKMLRLARSTLAPGGRLSLALPDWGAHVADYIDRQQRVPLRAPSIAGGMFRPEVNVMLNILYNWGHQMVYDEEMLRLVLDAAGWAKAAITHPDGANLVVEAVKID